VEAKSGSRVTESGWWIRQIIDGEGRWWRWCGVNGVSRWQGGIRTTVRGDSSSISLSVRRLFVARSSP
jgi:hypothetical protein